MSKQTYGDGNDCYIFQPATVANTVARVSTILDLRRFDCVALQLIAAGGAGTLDGTWLIEVSNDFTPNATAAPYGQAPNAASAHWTDITASKIWVDAIVSVAHATAASTNQYIQPITGIGARALQVTFTGTTGSATVAMIAFLKSWS